MKRQVLEDLLKRHADAKADGDVLIMPEGMEASLYVAMSLEPLVVDRVSAIRLEAEALIADTRRKERYVIAYEDVRAVRLLSADAQRTGY